MSKRNKFKLRPDKIGYHIIRDGHTMFPQDIAMLLDRLDYLEALKIKIEN